MLTRWDALDVRYEVNRLQQEMQRLLGRSGLTRGWEVAATGAAPAVNLWEDAEGVYVESELPGLDGEDLEIYVTGRQLTLKGERKAPVVEGGVWHRQERGHGKFQRVVALPCDVEADGVEARFRHGVLLVKLPKRAESRPRKIDVRVN